MSVGTSPSPTFVIDDASHFRRLEAQASGRPACDARDLPTAVEPLSLSAFSTFRLSMQPTLLLAHLLSLVHSILDFHFYLVRSSGVRAKG